ncbi:MAG: hypothetical protein K6T83_07625, partial [Alicyclobacillus sp.]|nr:hypothetical protein [Alicyclobacillus sp.]
DDEKTGQSSAWEGRKWSTYAKTAQSPAVNRPQEQWITLLSHLDGDSNCSSKAPLHVSACEIVPILKHLGRAEPDLEGDAGTRPAR